MRTALLALALAVAVPALAQTTVETLVYRPPAGELKPRRVAGNVRGAMHEVPAVLVLAPDHLGLTVRERPTLLWFLSAPTTARIEIALVDPRRVEPLLDVAIEGAPAGIHAVRLDDRALRLEPGVAYEWSVAIVIDPVQRSRDVVTAGAVMHVDAPPGVREPLAAGDAGKRIDALAAAGIWYDALALLTEAIALRPGDTALRAQRAALLEQAGLVQAAAFERQR